MTGLGRKKKEIPQNSKTNFVIRKSLEWDFSIELLINTREAIIMDNLYKIFESFYREKVFLCIYAVFIYKRGGVSTIITKISLGRVMEKDAWEFEEWLFKRIFSEPLYNVSEWDSLSIQFLFDRDHIRAYNSAFNTDILKDLYPLL